jgi:hypothetical protein
MTRIKPVKVESLYEDLGEKERLFLRQGTVPRGKSRSELIQSVADSAVNRGWTREKFREVMLRRSNKGAAKILEKSANAARAYLDRSWDKAIKFVRQNPPISNGEAARRHIRAMRAAIDRMDWSYPNGWTHYAVLIVHLDIAETLGRLEYEASIRRVAGKAGVTKDTVMNAHDRLTRLLIPLAVPVGRTSRWKLRTAAGRDSNNLRICEEYCPDQRSGSDHDVWHQWGMGKGGWRTWNALNVTGGMTSSGLAGRLRAKPRTTTDRLKRLERLGMARRSGSHWFRVERDLDEVAAELGTLGRLAARKSLHRAEQERYEKRRQERRRPGSKLTVISDPTNTSTELPKREQPVFRSEPDVLPAALSYALMGFRVLPLQSIRDGRCTCGKSCQTPGKHPIGRLVPHGLKGATREVEVIREWWARCPFANVGIATGIIADGLYLNVIDVDPRNGGNDTFVDLIAAGGLPETGTSRTGSGGTHWLLTSTEPLRSSGALGKGIDFKGVGGYIVAPPSLHHSGQRYEWVRPLENLASVPNWVVDKLNAKNGGRTYEQQSGVRKSLNA